MEHKFTCYQCGKEKVHISDYTTGYGSDNGDHKICVDCCGLNDAQHMRDNNRVTLYLCGNDKDGWTIQNWPGTLKIKIWHVRKGRHNIARVRYDCWFPFAGKEWHGAQYGDMTQLIHCRALKGGKI